MSNIAFEHITKRYSDGFEAVKDMNINVDDGEFMVLVGPSGSGKSTALRMVAGLEDITEGELKIGNKIVNQRAPKDRDIAMVFQNYALYPHMTVRENMGFALKLARTPRKKQELQVNRLKKFKQKNVSKAEKALDKLADAVESGENTFPALLEAAEVCSLGQITARLQEIVGHFRPMV